MRTKAQPINRESNLVICKVRIFFLKVIITYVTILQSDLLLFDTVKETIKGIELRLNQCVPVWKWYVYGMTVSNLFKFT